MGEQKVPVRFLTASAGTKKHPGAVLVHDICIWVKDSLAVMLELVYYL